MSDLISRSALIRTIKCRKDVHKVEYAHDKRESDFIRCCECSEIERLVNEAPTVEAKPVVHGEWLEVNGCLSWFYQCSVCDEYNECKTNFCKHCGADMQGGSNEQSL